MAEAVDSALRIDLHTHSNVSDGTDSPTQLVAAAKANDLDVVALTDHDTFAGLSEAAAAGSQAGVQIINGVEFSTAWFGNALHLLGYGCRQDDQHLQAELAKVVQARTDRVPEMLHRLEQMGLPVPAEVLAKFADQATSVGRPHIADAMVELGYVPDRASAFERFLGVGRRVYVHRYATDLPRAIELVKQAGGVAVLAHGLDDDRGQGLDISRIEALVVEHQLDGLEVDHPRHGPHDRAQLRELATRHQLIATGSSDYHGRGKVAHEIGQELTSPQQYHRLIELIQSRGGRAFA